MVCALASACLADDSTQTLFKAAQRAEKAGDTLQAYLLYAKAAALEPRNIEFAMKKAALQADAALSARVRIDDSLASTERFSGSDARANILDARESRMPPRLRPAPGPKNFDLKGDPRQIFEKVMEAYGLLVVFEGDYQAPPPFTFRVNDVSAEDALRALETVSNSFLVPVNEKLALVVRDTPQKRTEMAPALALEIPIPQRISVQDATEMVTAVQQTMEIRRINVDPTKRTVYMRDQASKVEAARAMFFNLSRLRAQIEVDVEFLEVTKSSALGYGLSLPNSSAIVDFGKKLQSKPSIPSGFDGFLTFGSGGTFLGIGIAKSMLVATLTKNDQTSHLNAQIIALDGQAATLRIGNRYPIINASYSGGSIGTSSGLAATPSINYEDLGLVLKITPSIHDGGEVTLDVSAEFKVLGATGGNGIPTISNRKFEGKVRLAENEWAIVAGLVNTTDAETRSGIAGVSSLPAIGRFLRSNTHNKNESEVLLVLKPHLIDLPPWELGSKTIWVGSETKPLTTPTQF